MPPRLFVDRPPSPGEVTALPASAARHVQVLRLQPGDALRLFDGSGAEWPATVAAMGRSDVTVMAGAASRPDRELRLAVTLAIGMPANERMDGVVEKATELGVARLQPLVCERSVLRLAGERAAKKVAHWQAVAQAACEQSGRTRLPLIEPVRRSLDWLHDAAPSAAARRWVLSFADDARAAAIVVDEAVADAGVASIVCLSGPEGGLVPAEEAAARRAGFAPLTLGPRVLRADTAPLALLALLALRADPAAATAEREADRESDRAAARGPDREPLRDLDREADREPDREPDCGADSEADRDPARVSSVSGVAR